MWNKSAEELRAALAAPFTSSDIEWRVSVTSQSKNSGLAVAYVTNRAIQNRLDDTVGVDGWYNEFIPWKNGAAQLCGISIYFAEKDIGLTKFDGADDSDIEAVKGGLSDSMKRAAVEWGIGRYLYGMDQIWVDVIPRGKSFAIADHEFSRLASQHDAWVKTHLGSPAGPVTQPSPRKETAGSREVQESHGAPQKEKHERPRPPAHETKPPQEGETNPSAQGLGPAPQSASSSKSGPVSVPEGCYLITGAVLRPTMSGGQRLNLQLRSSDGQNFQAFLRGEANGRLSPGVLITDAQFSTKNSGGVTFFVLESYQFPDMGESHAA